MFNELVSGIVCGNYACIYLFIPLPTDFHLKTLYENLYCCRTSMACRNDAALFWAYIIGLGLDLSNQTLFFHV